MPRQVIARSQPIPVGTPPATRPAQEFLPFDRRSLARRFKPQVTTTQLACRTQEFLPF